MCIGELHDGNVQNAKTHGEFIGVLAIPFGIDVQLG
jgi:hypothetical protein